MLWIDPETGEEVHTRVMESINSNSISRSNLIQNAHKDARDQAINHQQYVLLNGLLHCPSGVSLPMPWHVKNMKDETLRIVELLGGQILPDFEPGE